MGELTTKIAEQIKKHRTRLNLNKRQLSDLVDVAPSTVSGWENGDYAPGVDTLVKLCDIFHITLDEIYGLKKASLQKNGHFPDYAIRIANAYVAADEKTKQNVDYLLRDFIDAERKRNSAG